MIAFTHIVFRFLADLLGLLALSIRPRRSLEAEKLFLRRQLALYKERGIKPRRVDAATRMGLVLLSKLFDWRCALIIVRPETLIRWHRAGWLLVWRWKCRPGRPPIPPELRQLIRRIAVENPLWGEERIANELLTQARGAGLAANSAKVHAQATSRLSTGRSALLNVSQKPRQVVIACDFFAAVTATFRMLYVFVVIHHSSRRPVHFNVTAHPTPAWTLQQLREAVGYEECYRYLIHDRDSIFAKSLGELIARLGMTVLKSPFQSPKANAICERAIRTIRRECLEWMIPLSEAHLRLSLKSWVGHYNGGRPHMSLGPSVPDPPAMPRLVQHKKSRHRLGVGLVLHAESILGGCITSIHWRRRSPDAILCAGQAR